MQSQEASGASGSPSAKTSNHDCRQASRAARSGRIRSPSLTIPIGAPLSSTTGTAVMLLSSISLATARNGVSGCTDTTGLLMISRAFISLSSTSYWRSCRFRKLYPFDFAVTDESEHDRRMIAIGLLVARMLRDFFKPRPRLEAEILILRHQLNVVASENSIHLTR